MSSAPVIVALVLGAFVLPLQMNVQRHTVAVTDTNIVMPADPGRALYEPSLAVDAHNPQHWIVVAIDSGRGATFEERTHRQTCRVLTTFDDGHTFTAHDFDPTECFDPWVVFTPAGTVVLSLLGKRAGEPTDELLIFRSSDGGRTWPDPPASLGHNHDHPVMVADATAGPTRGWIYVTSHRPTRAGNGERRWGPYVARSRDDGKTFDDPVTVVPNNLHNLAEMPVVLSDGTLMVSFVDAGYFIDARKEKDFDRRRAWMIRSNDGGHLFSTPLFVTDACGPPPGYRLSALAADVSSGAFRDRLYFACRERGGGPIVVSASGNRGDTWSAPVAPRPNPASAPDRIPGVAVNSAGTLLAAWMEGWSEPSENCRQALTASASTDGGQTFFGDQQISKVPSCADGTHVASTTGGDYFGLAPLSDNAFRLVWSETPDGRSRLMTAVVHVR
jgi:hypothetical protein